MKSYFLVSLFLSLFLFSNLWKIQLYSFTMQRIDILWKLLEHLQENVSGREFQFIKMASVTASAYQYSENLLMVAFKHWTETHSFKW